MPAKDPPGLGDLFADLDRRRAERDDELYRAAAERRRAVERFRERRREIIRPAVRELERELRRRRHTAKVVECESSIQVTVAVRTRQARDGSLRMYHDPAKPDHLRLEYQGLDILPDKFDLALDKLDRPLVTRALMRLVEGLLDD